MYYRMLPYILWMALGLHFFLLAVNSALFLEMGSFIGMQRSSTWEWLGQSSGLAGSGATHLSTSLHCSGRISADMMTSLSWKSTALSSQEILPFPHTLVHCLNCFYHNNIFPYSEFTLTLAPHYHSFFSAHWQICRHLPFFKHSPAQEQDTAWSSIQWLFFFLQGDFDKRDIFQDQTSLIFTRYAYFWAAIPFCSQFFRTGRNIKPKVPIGRDFKSLSGYELGSSLLLIIRIEAQHESFPSMAISSSWNCSHMKFGVFLSLQLNTRVGVGMEFADVKGSWMCFFSFPKFWNWHKGLVLVFVSICQLN